ncbi:MAG TPA: glycosyltransferase [Methylomirabilota bacterium]|jgi:glycosyltransferase involved in cell wall biosynthesis|nr:glycosyltransferase [Methylomirabilota bacterium]
MRILQVLHEFPPDAWAGVGLVTLQLSQALQARGHEVAVLTRIDDPDAEEFSLREEQRYDLEVIAVVNNYTKITSLRSTYDNDFFTEPFIQLLTRVRPDVVHFQHVAHFSPNLIMTAAELGYPTVLSLHDFYFACHLLHLVDQQNVLCPGPDRGERCVACLRAHGAAEEIRARFLFMDNALQTADLVLAPSQFLAQRMAQYFPAIAPRLRVAPLGVDRPPLVRREERRPGQPLRILYAGVLIPQKGAHVLLEAVQELPPQGFRISLYGNVLAYWQPYVDHLYEMAKGLPVRFSGVYAHDELGAILAQHDVLVVPGICEETFSLLTREALLAGLPVIAARRGALPEAIRDGENGFFFEPEDPADLRRRLLRLVEDPDLLARLREPQPRVRTVAEYTEEIEAMYQEVCSDAFRAEVLPQRLAARRKRVGDLQQRNAALQTELEKWRARHAVVEGQRSCETAQLRRERDEARAMLEEKERQLQEHQARLQAIYQSTTWKLYRCYCVLSDYAYQRPLSWLRRWLR